MKKLLGILFAIIVVSALVIGGVYGIDHHRMSLGEPVLFSTWGRDYAPDEETEAVSSTEEVTDTQEKNEPQAVNAKLYFADTDVLYLHAEERSFENSDNIAKEIAEALIEGPQSDDLIPVINDKVKVLSAKIEDGSSTCVIDLSEEFATYNTGGSTIEMMSMYSIVNSLCSLEGINDVKINIEGDENAFFGHFDISEPIEADMSIVK